MTGLQVALLSGGLIGLGVVLVVARLIPARPDAADVVARVGPTRASGPSSRTGPVTPSGSLERAGAWALRTLPDGVWTRTPRRELALLGTPLTRYCGEKVAYVLMGLVAGPSLVAIVTVLGLDLPFVVPAVASLALAGVLFFIPDYNAIEDAKTARTQYRRALTAYADLVALERAGGSGVRQAMENAAAVADAPLFDRLAEELARSRWSGMPPWDALEALADELGLPELNDLAGILRLSGTESTAIYESLRARSSAMRTAIINDDLAAANAVGERLSLPASALVIVFMALLVAPSVLRLLGHT
ncbi:hypothetical protein GCM10028784_29860 [Myceligenerans cantabricum]